LEALNAQIELLEVGLVLLRRKHAEMQRAMPMIKFRKVATRDIVNVAVRRDKYQ
jgi:hypothetical protein